ncbi:hypothetical protein OHA72_51130 [Dactylosporangium sp. NBC_01737]|uniref:hypothetical protein n=1 Tax=Dactylosporangium sp. NBC_01737 TaxID=2975959 RepID=UPI002E14A60F|nr:hypothetical protein OHA72_51130 [Dactylosporangium sp. NBC_01737]
MELAADRLVEDPPGLDVRDRTADPCDVLVGACQHQSFAEERVEPERRIVEHGQREAVPIGVANESGDVPGRAGPGR